MADQLHSRRDDELESKDQRQFSRAVVLAGIAILLIFAVALIAVRWAGRQIHPVNPDKHPTSELHQLRPAVPVYFG